MSTSVDRTSIVRGAATVKLGALQYFDKANVSANLETTWMDDKVSGYGNIDKTRGDTIITADWTPSGEISAAILAALYPYGATAIDASMCGATDTVAEIHSLVGKKLTIHNVFLSQMPALKLGAQETPFGPAALIGLPKNSTARSAANSLYTVADAAWTGTFDRAKKVKSTYSAIWNSIPIIAKESWNIEFDLQLNRQMTDDLGTFDYTMGGLTVRAKCRPINLSETLWDSLRGQGTGGMIGSSGRQAQDLVISADIAGAIDLTLKDAIFAEGPLSWGEDELRAGEIGFEATRDLTSGYGAMFTIAFSS